MIKIIKILIDSNIFIALSGVALTFASQVQLGLDLQIYNYIFVIFFGILLEYNLHKFYAVIKNNEEIKSEKYSWAKNNKYIYFSILIIAFILLIYFFINLKLNIILYLIPFAILNLLYSLPIYKKIKIRKIPLIKIFLIAFVWTFVTLIIPFIYSELKLNNEIYLLFIERFIFIFAITIPFDIRDIVQDKINNIKTIPIILGENKSYLLSNLLIIIFSIISTIHYLIYNNYLILSALIITAIITLILLNNSKIKNNKYYHYGFLDGTMMIYGLLIILSEYLKY